MGPGGFNNSMQIDESKSTRFSVSINGAFGQSSWDYDIGYTRTDYKLDELGFVRWADPINNFFETNVLGPQQGWDPYFGNYPVFTPNYSAFYQIRSRRASSRASPVMRCPVRETVDEMIRAQFTTTDLFQLPGGAAGLAVVAEYGQQEWSYTRDPGYLNRRHLGHDGGGWRRRP